MTETVDAETIGRARDWLAYIYWSSVVRRWVPHRADPRELTELLIKRDYVIERRQRDDKVAGRMLTVLEPTAHGVDQLAAHPPGNRGWSP
jgi:hypothetical protein